MVVELITVLAVVAFTAVLLAFATKDRFSAKETKYVWFGYIAHVLGAIAQIVVTRSIYGGGDLFGYYVRGIWLLDWLKTDFFTALPAILYLSIGGAPDLPVYIVGLGESTGAMAGISALALAPVGGSLYGGCIVLSLWAFSGQLALYQMGRHIFPKAYRFRVAVACFFIPSVVFWSSGILKESVAIGAFGWLLLATYWSIRGARTRLFNLCVILICAGIISVVKAYLLIPYTLATLGWYFSYKAGQRSARSSFFNRPGYLFATLLAVTVALIVLGSFFPRFSITSVTDETARMQELYARTGGGSNIEYATRDESTTTTQIQYAPLGLATALFRPVIFEVHNATSFLNGLEMLFITIIVFLTFYRRGWRGMLAVVKQSPFLVFALVFVIVFATGVGLSAPNLGSLSRYRIPMMPIYGLLLTGLLPLRARRGRA